MIGAGNNVSASDITEVLNIINQARRKFSCGDTNIAVAANTTIIQSSQIGDLKASLESVNSISGANKDLNSINNFTAGNAVKASIMDLLKSKANEVYAYCPCNCNNCACDGRCSCENNFCSCETQTCKYVLCSCEGVHREEM